MRLCHKGLGQAWLGEKRTAATLTGVMVEATEVDPCVDNVAFLCYNETAKTVKGNRLKDVYFVLRKMTKQDFLDY